jgi:hypothetical protein
MSDAIWEMAMTWKRVYFAALIKKELCILSAEMDIFKEISDLII